MVAAWMGIAAAIYPSQKLIVARLRTLYNTIKDKIDVLMYKSYRTELGPMSNSH